ncbi:MAG: hypothetical protein B7Z20_13305, partial [Sphingobium sp. 32-64-5]
MKISRGFNGLKWASAPFALALAGLVAPAAVLAQAGEAGLPASVTTQLPRGPVPSHYAIKVTPDAANLTFDGEVTIDLSLPRATQAITLNAADLIFASASIAPAQRGRATPGTVSVDAAAQTATIRFARDIAPGRYK